VEGDRPVGQDGEGIVGAARVERGWVGAVDELSGVGQDFGAGNAADSEDLCGEGVEGGGCGKGGGHGGGSVEGQEGVGVRADVAVEAVGVDVGGDAGEADCVVVGGVGLVLAQDGGDVRLEFGGAGGKGVVDVRREAAAAGGKVNGVQDGD